MNKIFKTIIVSSLILIANFTKAQTVLQINGADCNGVNHDLYADLDSGKAVVLFFWMPNCSTCPPEAKKIQTMVNNVLKTYPNKVTGYALPFNNSTTCATSSSWITTNNLPLFIPYSNGATQVANYGGFGMPTVVLLGGKGTNRRVLFSTLSFTTSDTTIMRDSILKILKSVTAVLSLDCSKISTTGTLKKGVAASGAVINMPYTYTKAGDTYPLSTVTSTGVTGLTAKLTAGTYQSSSDFKFDITGTPTSAGDAVFNLSVNGQSCTYKFAVANSGNASILNTTNENNLNAYSQNNQVYIISEKALQNVNVTLFDIQGKTIINQLMNINEGQNSILKSLNKGMYILNLKKEQIDQTIKFVVE